MLNIDSQEALMVWIVNRLSEKFGDKALLKGGMVLRFMKCPRLTFDIDYVFSPYQSRKEIWPLIEETLKELEGVKIEKAVGNNTDVIPWKIRERGNWGDVSNLNRNESSLQKDWAILKSYELPEELHFAVVAHKGWDVNKEPVPYALTVSIEILGKNITIYNEIRLENGIEVPIEVKR